MVSAQPSPQWSSPQRPLFDIATTTPTTTSLIPTVMGAAITVASEAVIPGLWRSESGRTALPAPS